MSISIYPGSFDPVTLGHIDIIKRAAKMTDLLIVGVLKNSAKKGLFTIEEREEMLREVTKDIPNVEIKSFDGLLVDFAKENNANTIGASSPANFNPFICVINTINIIISTP